jgi:hypothetical protein
MLVFFGIANIFLGLLALDAATENPTYTQSAKVAYGVVVGLMIMMYMLFQPKTATFKVRSLLSLFSLSVFFTTFWQRGETFRTAFVRFLDEMFCFELVIRFKIIVRPPSMVRMMRAIP